MVRNAIQYPASVLGDAISNVKDAGNLSGPAMVATGLLVGAGLVFAPHLLAVNGAIALFGSLGRAAGDKVIVNGRSCIIGGNGSLLEVSSEQTIDEFLADPSNA
jgi:hypothetical protein